MEKYNGKMKFCGRICALIALIACVIIIAACNANPETLPEPTQTTTTSSAAEPITLTSQGRVKVSIVYSIHDNSFARDSAFELRDSLEELCGAKIDLEIDSMSKEKEGFVQILVGNTAYEQSKTAMSALAPNSYSITVSDNKIVVVANNIYLYSEAIEELFSAVMVSNGAMTLAGDYSKISESYPVISLSTGKKSDYMIIYKGGDIGAQTQANAIRNAFASAGITVQIYPESKKGSVKEILVGNTDRELSQNTEAYYLNAYICCNDRGDIAITGNLAAGAQSIVEYIERCSGAGSDIVIPQFLLGIKTPAGYGNTPRYEGSGKVTLTENFEAFKSYFVQADGATKKDYNDYAAKLVASGYSLYYKTEAQDSLFSTYTDGYNIVNLSYVEYMSPFNENNGDLISYVNIAVDCTDKGALPQFEDNSEKITEIQVTHINSENSYLVRLEDGRFLMIDGGTISREGRNNADMIYKQLVAQNEREGKPIVAAWLITHPHGDHMNGYYDFSQKYKDKVDILSVICNMPNSAADMVDYSNRVYNTLDTYYPEADFIVAHIGQRFAFAGLDLDILWTHENLYGVTYGDTNLSSMVFSMQMPAGRMIITGDQQWQGCKIINAIYAEELECDIVQFCHHSYNGGDIGMYDSMNPRVGIWSTNIEDALERGLYGRLTYNNIIVDNYEMHLIMSAKDEVMILRADMTKDDLLHYRNFEK